MRDPRRESFTRSAVYTAQISLYTRTHSGGSNYKEENKHAQTHTRRPYSRRVPSDTRVNTREGAKRIAAIPANR